MAIICFTTILTAAIWNIFTDAQATSNYYNYNSSSNLLQKNMTINNLITADCCCINDNCIVSCDNIPSSISMHACINNCIDEEICTKIELHINNTAFQNRVIEKSWLKDLIVPVVSLTLYNSPIVDIEIDAFKSGTFRKLQKILLLDLYGLTYLRRGTFRHLIVLTDFAIRYDGQFNPINFEENVFDGAPIIATMLLQNCITEASVLHNITGKQASELPFLQTFDIQFNQLSTVEAYSFINAKGIQALHLSNTMLKSIDEKAFWNVPLRSIYLKDNSLTDLPPRVFRDKYQEFGMIHAERNSWFCDCKLEWFAIYYKTTDLVVKPLYCNDGEENYKFDEYVFDCDTTTSPSTVSTTISTDDSTTSSTPLPFRLISCQNLFNFPIVIPHIATKELISSTTINLQPDHLTVITINEINELDDLPIIEIVVQNIPKNSYLLWFKHDDSANYGCYTQFEHPVYIYNLLRDTTYTLCLIEEGEDDGTASTYQCLGFHISPEWNERIWIRNVDLPIFIGVSCVILILVLFITIIVVFFILCQYPTLLRGNKRIIIVESMVTEEIITANECQGEMNKPPSFVSSNYGYWKIKDSPYCSVMSYRPPILKLSNIKEEEDSTVMNVNDRHVVGSVRVAARRRNSLTNKVIVKLNDVEVEKIYCDNTVEVHNC